MKIIGYILLIVLFFSCEKSEYETWLYEPGIEAVDSVAIYPNSPVLIANGKAQLSFLVKAYSFVKDKRTIEQVINGEHIVKDSVFTKISAMKMDRFEASDIQIKTGDGKLIEGQKFSTTEGAGTDIEFVCTIHGIESEPCKVHLIADPVIEFPAITIPVVFHLLVTDENVIKYDGITTELLQRFIERANKVFSGTYADDPVAVDSKIRFELATVDDRGNKLATPGINRVEMGDPDYGEVEEYINENLLWDPDRILNIWVNDEIYGTNAYGPAYVLDNGTTIPGFELTSVTTAGEVEFSSWEEAGMTMSVGSIFSLNKSGSGNSEHLEYYLGTHLGLLPTVYNSYSDIEFIDGDVDFCSDTYTYQLGPISQEKNTYSDDKEAPVIYYNSYNIMDESSASTSLTYEQVLRIRKVMANCPGRMFN